MKALGPLNFLDQPLQLCWLEIDTLAGMDPWYTKRLYQCAINGLLNWIMYLFFLIHSLQLLACNFTRVIHYIQFFIFGCLISSALHNIPTCTPYGYEMSTAGICILLLSFALLAISLTFPVNTLCASHCVPNPGLLFPVRECTLSPLLSCQQIHEVAVHLKYQGFTFFHYFSTHFIFHQPHNISCKVFINVFRVYKEYEAFFSIWVFFHKHSRFPGQQGKEEAISLIPLYHFHPLHRHLDIS